MAQEYKNEITPIITNIFKWPKNTIRTLKNSLFIADLLLQNAEKHPVPARYTSTASDIRILPITPGLHYNEITIIIILHKVNHQHQHEVDDLFEKACLVGCLLSCVLLLICPLAKHLVHVEVVIAQNGAERVEEETWGNIFCSYTFQKTKYCY